MHMVIYALVEAPTRHDALIEGKAVFDRLVGANPHGCAVFGQKQSNSQSRVPLPTFKYQTGDTRERINGR
jgi:hypothetical protein